MMSLTTTTTVGESPICAPVQSYDLQTLEDERSKTLHSLLKQGHEELALLLGPKLFLHSHMPHKLGSAYLLGFEAEQLTEMYHAEAVGLNYEKSETGFIKTGITLDTWRHFVNHKPYTVAFTKFFDQEVANRNGDWKSVLMQYLFSSPKPLISGFIGGLGHPFIHLAYAFELESPEVAAEALSLGCTERDFTHQWMDEPWPTTTTSNTDNSNSRSLKEILTQVHSDPRFDNLYDLPGYANIYTIFFQAPEALLEHWHKWDISDPRKQFEEALQLATYLAVETETTSSDNNSNNEYDFYFAHTLTVGHALRVLLPHFPAEHVVPVLRQFWMFILYLYLAQMRPDIQEPPAFAALDLNGRDWEWVRQRALAGEHAYDSHRLKVLRALMVMDETWGHTGGYYLRAAVKFVSTFDGWTGFGKGLEGLLGDE